MSAPSSALGVRYAFADGLPDHLLGPTVASLHGELVARGTGVATLRAALRDGEVPDHDALSWPDEGLRAALLDTLRETDLASFCRDDPELADAVLLSVLETLDDTERLRRQMLQFVTQLAILDARARTGGG